MCWLSVLVVCIKPWIKSKQSTNFLHFEMRLYLFIIGTQNAWYGQFRRIHLLFFNIYQAMLQISSISQILPVFLSICWVWTINIRYLFQFDVSIQYVIQENDNCCISNPVIIWGQKRHTSRFWLSFFCHFFFQIKVLLFVFLNFNRRYCYVKKC